MTPVLAGAAALAVVAGLCLLAGAGTAQGAHAKRYRSDSFADSLQRNPIIADVADTYRDVPVQLYLVAGIVFIVGLLLRVPVLICVLGGAVFLSLPLVQGLKTDQIIWWGAVGSVVFLVLHHLVTSSRDRHL